MNFKWCVISFRYLHKSLHENHAPYITIYKGAMNKKSWDKVRNMWNHFLSVMHPSYSFPRQQDLWIHIWNTAEINMGLTWNCEHFSKRNLWQTHCISLESVQAVDCEIYHSIKVVLKVTKYATSHIKLCFPFTLSCICYFLKIHTPTEPGPNLLSFMII